MKVGILLIFQNYHGRERDEDVVRKELAVAELAEPLGFDRLWCVEHHFTDYAACPDNLQFLSYMAAKTTTLELATGAVIVPWNNPLRVAEKVSLLDHLSGGRAILGIGRGLARVEYEHFGIDMNESRDRFDEASRMILDALEEGFIEGDGPYYPQIRTEIRPRPLGGFRDRLYSIGMSPESVRQAAELGGHLAVFSQEPWESFAANGLAQYRERFREVHGTEPLAPLTGDLVFCHEDAGRAEEIAMEYMQDYFLTIIQHYEILSDHFKDISGYDHYATASELFKQVGLDVGAQAYCQVQAWGTPDTLLEKLRHRHELLGSFEFNMIANYGGMPFELVEESLRLFSREVLPELKKL
jgi:alkanesulfonate monooxygenase SsuD/methylene tetrahydromethanopterin reductase-like flavin-dependent oxidoreductase (luciferase family)